MRVTRSFAVNLPIGRIDMYRWLTEMTSEDYESYAPAHKAMSSFFQGSRFFAVNVESIGVDLLIQHYELVNHSQSHVTLLSRSTEGFVFRWFPVTIGVPWDMRLQSTSSRTCELTCTIGADFNSPLLAALAWLKGTRFFLNRHLAVEGSAFAKDIERKFALSSDRSRSVRDRLSSAADAEALHSRD